MKLQGGFRGHMRDILSRGFVPFILRRIGTADCGIPRIARPGLAQREYLCRAKRDGNRKLQPESCFFPSALFGFFAILVYATMVLFFPCPSICLRGVISKATERPAPRRFHSSIESSHGVDAGTGRNVI